MQHERSRKSEWCSPQQPCGHAPTPLVLLQTLDARLQRMENLAQTRSSMLSYAPTAPTTGRRGSVVDTRGSGNADAVQSAHIVAIRQELTGKPDLGVVESMLLSKADADVTKQVRKCVCVWCGHRVVDVVGGWRYSSWTPRSRRWRACCSSLPTR